MSINFRKLKQTLTKEQIIKILVSLGSSIYEDNTNEIIFYSCCHHKNPMEHKAKLYYYPDTQSFFCYSCSSSFDIISLVQERWNLENKEFMFMDVIAYIMQTAGIEFESVQRLAPIAKGNTPWQDILGKYDRLKNNESKLKVWDKNILNFFTNTYPLPWLEEGISLETMYHFNIKYYRLQNQTLIPCFDDKNNLVGIRVRNWQPTTDRKYDSLKTVACFDDKNNLVEHEIYGTDFKFQTNQVLYGLNMNQYSIEQKKKAIIAESEKAVLKSHTWYGHNSITLGLFGNNLNNRRRNMILERGVDEVIIAPDYDYLSLEDPASYSKWWNSQMKIAKKFQGFCQVSILMNYNNLVPHKNNGFDVTQSEFETLMEQRKNIFELNERKQK